MPRSSSDPLITVGVACHNDGSFLAEALDSAVRQTHEHLEIVVFDDGSSDGSDEIARAVDDERISVIRTPTNGGVSRARQRIKERAGGDFLVWLDADDRFDPGRLELLLDAARRSDADLAVDASRFIDERGEPLPGRRSVPDLVASDRCFTRLFERNLMPPHPLISRRCFSAIDFDPAIRTSEDYDVWLRCVRAGFTFARVDEVAMDYRVRAGSLSSDPAASRAALRRILAKHDLHEIVSLYRERGFGDDVIHQMACIQLIHRGDVCGAFEHAEQPWPGEPGADRDFYLGSLALMCDRPELAEEHLRRHLDRAPRSPAGLNNLGVLVADQGGDGSELWREALRWFPGYLDARSNLSGHRSTTLTQLDGDRPR